MQLRVNLSIQLPGDDSSLLPVHSDIWNGDSAYEVVAWLPLVDCRRTKSMFLLPPEPNERALARFAALGSSSEDVFHAIEPELLWLEIKAGEILIFSPTLMHGNRINREPDTRWSMNCRFKGLFTPYADKRLGEFFEPITLRPTTRIGAAFRLPDVAR
jgi:sporadic carbohydrate cluster 2OG-Fe(II) oxygenase